MLYFVLAQLVMGIHVVWILFIILGVVFAYKGSKIAFLHVGGLLFSLFLNISGWYCPLTYLENFLLSLCEPSSVFPGSFVARVLDTLIYPDLPEKVIRGGQVLFVCFYMLFYLNYYRKYKAIRPSIKVEH
ncbi:MAG: DUF2784 domain-containing protein [Deltaproteobacteria bacterium]|nr:DUF2784 domain-containing protein [Deltaproteobacteria bacterium]MBW1979419.1 DUF2784 domain-containing protein [Deltaproteobacteria bacterium]MBW2302053.1 DUF2784 domain-containing protein [Deltaproteobacteria bacterium]